MKKESMNDTFSEKEIKETLLKFIKQEGNAKMHEHLQHASACYLTNYYKEEEKISVVTTSLFKEEEKV